MRTKNNEYFKLIENYIDNYRDTNGTVPSVREIATGIGISKSTVSRYLTDMREDGIIEYSGCRNISTRKAKKTQSDTIEVPVVGLISCGLPFLAEENIDEYVHLPVSLFGSGEFFILRASGDSMIEAGICSGDLVLIRQQNYADEGQIVVALIEDDATLKRFYPEPENHRIRLHPENCTMDDIYADDCMIQGVAIKVIKDLE